MDENNRESSIDDLIEYGDTNNTQPEAPEAEEADEYREPEREAAEDTEEAAEYYEEEIEEETIEQEYPETEEREIAELYDPSAIFDYNTGDTEENKKKSGGVLRGVLTGIVIGLIVILVFMLVNTNLANTYKTNFSKNFSTLFGNFKSDGQKEVKQKVKTDNRYKTSVSVSPLISLDNTSGTEFVRYKEGVLYASMNHLAYIDASGKTVWEENTVVVDPILSAEGAYILLAERGGKKLCLYNDKKLIYDVDDPDNIVAAKVSARGDAIAVTDKSSYRGGISVYNKSGGQVYSWASGRDTVISADISSASRRAAVALLNTEASAKSIIQLFDLNEAQSYAQLEYSNTVIFNLHFTGNSLSAFGDNRVVVLTDSGKIVSETVTEDAQLVHTAIDEKGNKLLALDENNTPLLNMYNKNGFIKESDIISGIAGFVDINGRTVLYSIGRDIYLGKIGSDNMTKYTAAMDIQQLILISDKTFAIVYSNSMEVVTV